MMVKLMLQHARSYATTDAPPSQGTARRPLLRRMQPCVQLPHEISMHQLIPLRALKRETRFGCSSAGGSAMPVVMLATTSPYKGKKGDKGEGITDASFFCLSPPRPFFMRYISLAWDPSDVALSLCGHYRRERKCSGLWVILGAYLLKKHGGPLHDLPNHRSRSRGRLRRRRQRLWWPPLPRCCCGICFVATPCTCAPCLMRH